MDWKKLKLGLLFIGVFSALIAFAHPFYVSITSVDFNPSKKRVEVSCRLFYDDLEVALKNQLGQHIDVIHPKNKAAADSAISKYIRQNFKINVNNQPRNLRYVGYEIEEDVAWCYLEVSDVPAISKLDIVNQLLFKDFKNQSNIMHIKVNNTKKSTKLDNPKRTASFTF
ncbi:DUF6702 family protein [Sphingobacterium mizutaii]|uniref:DUF6702 family protein n=1 Tax=Sphingobacterium mizutaii TaxID=1010 RepID=UPI0028AA2EF8|nr:DUF6702 family protein [Sphingobacterium mizutaii]